jgi:hypothetical protein
VAAVLHRWVGPSAVQLSTWKGNKNATLTLSEFEHVFDGQASWNAEMRGASYWIQVVDGRVIAIGEVG